jgi:hypothetical protein
VSVAKGSDELWVGKKFQSNVEIAGSPRNASRCSRGFDGCGGRALIRRGGREPYQLLSNCEYHSRAPRVRQWVRTFIVKRETTQINS